MDRGGENRGECVRGMTPRLLVCAAVWAVRSFTKTCIGDGVRGWRMEDG